MHKQVQIFVMIVDQFGYLFVAALEGMGIVSTSTNGFIVVAMYCNENFPTVIYMSACVLFSMGLFLNFLLITLAAIPNLYGKRFKCYWSRRMKSRLSRMQIKACPSMGFSIVVILKVKRHTALTIADTELNFTATMVLTEQNM